jgi:hypothetical protein
MVVTLDGVMFTAGPLVGVSVIVTLAAAGVPVGNPLQVRVMFVMPAWPELGDIPLRVMV